MTHTSARIVLVEDHAILREGLRALIDLEPDLKVVGEASTGAEGVRVVQGSNPTLVITDLAMPGGSGLQTIDELRAVCPGLRVLVLTAYCTDEYIAAALGGESNKRVAVALRLSVKTVEKHRANLMRKLELHNTAAVTLFAVRNGLLPTRDTEPSFEGRAL
ncbi:MAG: response regulator transcription factor [Gammaproteobacteria bacterium]|nr:MAG: response regulator transcription factor [Gammaproteobacteria bacterium]